MSRQASDYDVTLIDYHHPYCAPDPNSVCIETWFDFGCRTAGRVDV